MARRLFGGKTPVRLDSVIDEVTTALSGEQQRMLDDAAAARDARIATVSTIEDAVEAAAVGWARMPWSAVGSEGEAKLGESAVTVRCLQREDGSVPDSDTEDGLVAFLARSY